MNAKIAGAAMLAAALGLYETAHADAYAFIPANSSFSATGTGSVAGSAGSYSCNISMTGTTGRTTGSITGATFSGAPGCENVTPMGLPWKFRATSTTKAEISHFDLSYPGLGRCGPNEVRAVVSAGNILIREHVPSKRGVCKIDASLSTSPALSISKK